jgi:hypothetical protein
MDNLNNDDCAICLEDKTNSYFLPCSHSFCYNCITKNITKCPLCRYEFIFANQFEQLDHQYPSKYHAMKGNARFSYSYRNRQMDIENGCFEERLTQILTVEKQKIMSTQRPLSKRDERRINKINDEIDKYSYHLYH